MNPTDQITDSVASRRMVARSLVPSNVAALKSHGLEVTNLDGVEYRVAGKVAFFPKNGFWRFLDGSRQGYGASRLIPALFEPAAVPVRIAKPAVDALVLALRKPEKKKSEKPAPGRDSDATGDRTADSTTASTVAIAESGVGASSRLLPAVSP